MSIKKIKVFFKTKFKKIRKKLDNEELEVLSLIDGKKGLQDLATLAKRNINSILKNLIHLEDLGVVELRLFCEDSVLQTLYERQHSIHKIYRGHPGITNIVAYEREWGIYPHVLDFLDKKSENYKLKNFEKDIYIDIIHPFFGKIPKGSTIIDAGGGIGRFALQFIKMGYRVHLVDSSEMALKRILRHLKNENLANFDLHWGNITNLSMFSDNSFNAALAIELICYSDEPDKAVKELVRVTKRKGLIIISVEGKYGSMLSDHNISFDKLSTIFKDDLLYIKNHLCVHYYTPQSLKRLLEECGVEVIDIFGSHYVTDGIFHKLINIDKLDDKNYKKDVLKIERLCQKDPILKNLARAWVAVGRKR